MVPRDHEADSFVLHAPLELAARSALLPMIEPTSRQEARERIVQMAADYAAYAPMITGDRRSLPVPTRAQLSAVLASGDLEQVDAAAMGLADGSSTDELTSLLADVVVASLAAAAHGSIFVYQLPRTLVRSRPAASMVRPLLRELARHADWTLRWIERRSSTEPSGDLQECLLAPPSAGELDSNFIFPTMSLVDRSGLAAALLDGPTREATVPNARRILLRVAAWSMVQDDAASAPYGWSHCLTMPQATLGIAGLCQDPATAVAVAATYVLGFRSTLGKVALVPNWSPAPAAHLELPDLLDAGPDAAASRVWYADPGEVDVIVRHLATNAATHCDAHLVKYTLACFDAARDDPDASRLFLAAAAFLAAWWRGDTSPHKQADESRIGTMVSAHVISHARDSRRPRIEDPTR